jgi:hypothetical protein
MPKMFLALVRKSENQALHPVEVGLLAFAVIAQGHGRELQVDVGVGLGRHAAILAAGEDEPVAAHVE